jgi:hypothetical protein
MKKYFNFTLKIAIILELFFFIFEFIIIINLIYFKLKIYTEPNNKLLFSNKNIFKS